MTKSPRFARFSRAAAAFAAAGLVTAAIVPATASAAPRDPVAERSSTPGTASRVRSDQRYCVVEDSIGSRIPRRICKTRDQWISENDFDPIRHR